ncbi:MAG: hypothetical protein FWD58_11205 [Firmicutes bacterium]|nr:hypothetical protein [Bacillota bacterium]
MNNQNHFETGDPLNPDPFSASQKEKKGILARFKAFIFDRKESSGEPKPTHPKKGPKADLNLKADADTIEKLNEFMESIETQLDRVDAQNKSLLAQVSLLKTNNETLLLQITTLTNNNNRLTEQFNASKRREKIAKTLAIVSAILAIGLSTYNFLRMIIGW